MNTQLNATRRLTVSHRGYIRKRTLPTRPASPDFRAKGLIDDHERPVRALARGHPHRVPEGQQNLWTGDRLRRRLPSRSGRAVAASEGRNEQRRGAVGYGGR